LLVEQASAARNTLFDLLDQFLSDGATSQR
jgi:hypothetical protein